MGSRDSEGRHSIIYSAERSRDAELFVQARLAAPLLVHSAKDYLSTMHIVYGKHRGKWK